jgi:hypothetical protein
MWLDKLVIPSFILPQSEDRIYVRIVKLSEKKIKVVNKFANEY